MKITRLFLLFLLVAGTTAVASAQTFRAALVAGANLSQIDGDALAGFHQIGLNAGLRAEARLSDRWSFGPELLFSQQGSRRAPREFSVSIDRVRLQTIELPLMVYFTDWHVQAEAGLSYIRWINYRVEDVTGEDITALTDYNPDNLAVNFGATLFFRPNLGLNFRWSKYLTDLDRDPLNPQPLLGRTISVRLVYMRGSSAWQEDS